MGGKKYQRQGGGGAHGGPSKAPPPKSLEDQLREAAKREAAKTGLDNYVAIRVAYLEGSFKCVSVADPASRIDVAIEAAGQLGIENVCDTWGLDKHSLQWALSAGFQQQGRILSLSEWAAQHFVLVKTKTEHEQDGGLSAQLKMLKDEVVDLKAKLKMSKDEVVDLKAKLKTSKDEVVDLKAEAAALKQDHEKLKQDYKKGREMVTQKDLILKR